MLGRKKRPYIKHLAPKVRRPVYIDAPPARTAAKHARLHRTLYERGAARPLTGAHATTWPGAPFDDAATVARAVRERRLL